MRRLLDPALPAHGPEAVSRAIVSEARRLFGVPRGALVEVREGERVAAILAGEAEDGTAAPALLSLADAPELAEAPACAEPARLDEGRASALGGALGWADTRTALLVPLTSAEGAPAVVVVGDRRARPSEAVPQDRALAFAAAAATPLGQVRRALAASERTDRAAALMRATEALHGGDDLDDVLRRLCAELAAGLGVTAGAVWRGSPGEGLTAAASWGFDVDVRGWRLSPGEGIAGQVAERGAPVIAGDDALNGAGGAFAGIRAAAGVPLVWGGEVRGVLAAYDVDPGGLDPAAVPLLEAVGRLAAVALRHADEHRGLARAASTDALTGCLNHAALHAVLRREVERSARTGHRLTLVLVDLDDFKAVNERHGHLVGDEVLRRVGHALRETVRPYDHVARYGGDEFALLAVDADEEEAAEIAGRGLERIRAALTGGGLPQIAEAAAAATAGVAQWVPGLSATELVGEADRALLYSKQRGLRGMVTLASTLPAGFVLSGERAGAAEGAVPGGTRGGRRAAPSRRGSARELALVGALAARLAGMTDDAEIAGAAVDELRRAGGYELCAALGRRRDGWSVAKAGFGAPFARARDGAAVVVAPGAGIVGRVLRERRPVVVDDALAEPDHVALAGADAARSELAAPVWAGGEAWGALVVGDRRPGAFDGDDLRLVAAAAGQMGSALRTAARYGRLEAAYTETAEALAAAVEARDAHSAVHSRIVARHAEAVGRRLAMSEPDLRDLRLGAILHDVGKIAVPERILFKPGPLTPQERRAVERHVLAGENILRPVPFLAGALPLVRHGHERWDGRGYPDGLRREDIPLGARIIAACDAWDAMRRERPYAPALTPEAARSELERNAGTQFDPGVVRTLLEVVDSPPVAPGPAPAPDPRAATR